MHEMEDRLSTGVCNFSGIFVDERPINENNSEDLEQDNGGKFSTDNEDKF